MLKREAEKVRRMYPAANGEFRVSVGGENLFFIGGPFSMASGFLSGRVFKVKMASEQKGHRDVAVPVEDFGVPKPADLLYAVELALEAGFGDSRTVGRSIFVGCGAGWGRTGLFLAVMLKVLMPRLKSQAFIVKELRRVYVQQAVETQAQHDLIESIDVSRLRRRVKWLWFGAKIRQLRGRFSFTSR